MLDVVCSSTIMGLSMTAGVLLRVLSWLVAVPLAFVLAQPLALGQAMIQADLDYAFNYLFVPVGWEPC